MDNHTYQENLVPKAHKQIGYEVVIIAGTLGYDKKSSETNSFKIGTYINEYGIKVTRLPYRWNNKVCKTLRYYKNLYETIEKANYWDSIMDTAKDWNFSGK